MSGSGSKTIRVDTLARVEGEGALYIKLVGERVADVKLKIYEPPRFFEAFLRGRHFSEAPDITPDGRYVVFYSRSQTLVPGVTYSGSNSVNLFIRDLQTNTTAIVSAIATASGVQDVEIPADAEFVMSADGALRGLHHQHPWGHTRYQ